MLQLTSGKFFPRKTFGKYRSTAILAGENVQTHIYLLYIHTHIHHSYTDTLPHTLTPIHKYNYTHMHKTLKTFSHFLTPDFSRQSLTSTELRGWVVEDVIKSWVRPLV